MVDLYHSAIRGQIKVLLLLISLLTQGLTQKSQKFVHVYSLVSVDLSIFLILILAEGYMVFKRIWRATQECIVALTEIMKEKKGDRLEEIT